MPAIKYKVELTESERSDLNEVAHRGKSLARTVKRALALLKADQGLSDREVAEAVSLSASTVGRGAHTVRYGGAGRCNQRQTATGAETKAGRQTRGAPRRHPRAATLPKDTPTGRCSYLPTKWWRWSLLRASPLRPSARY